MHGKSFRMSAKTNYIFLSLTTAFVPGWQGVVSSFSPSVRACHTLIAVGRGIWFIPGRMGECIKWRNGAMWQQTLVVWLRSNQHAAELNIFLIKFNWCNKSKTHLQKRGNFRFEKDSIISISLCHCVAHDETNCITLEKYHALGHLALSLSYSLPISSRAKASAQR